MKLLYIKTVLKNLQVIKLRNFLINKAFSGKRGANSFIMAWGNFGYRAEENTRINIEKGQLNLNKSFSKPDRNWGVLKMMKNATLNVNDNFDIYSGCQIGIMENAVLNLGSGYIIYNSKIRCYSKITIGNNVALSENLTILDSDSHELHGDSKNKTQPIVVGNHVWIGVNVTILKGVTIGDGSVIAAGSVVNRDVPPNCLAGGVPAKVIRENISWK